MPRYIRLSHQRKEIIDAVAYAAIRRARAAYSHEASSKEMLKYSYRRGNENLSLFDDDVMRGHRCQNQWRPAA